MKISLCKHSEGVEDSARALERSFPNLKVEIKSCIHQCNRCRKSLVANLNGQEIQAIDEKELLKEVKERLKKTGKFEAESESIIKSGKQKQTIKKVKTEVKKHKESKDEKEKNKKEKNKKEINRINKKKDLKSRKSKPESSQDRKKSKETLKIKTHKIKKKDQSK